MSLFKITCIGKQIQLDNYADLIIYDSKHRIAGIRFGGYPETVVGMTDVLALGGTLTVDIGYELTLNTLSNKNFSRKVSNDGIYAESVLFAKDTELNLSPAENEKREMYIFCKTDSRQELYEELDKKLSVPLIPAFTDYLINSLTTAKSLEKLKVISASTQIYAYKLTVGADEKDVVEILNMGLKNGDISIPQGVGNIFSNINGFSDYLREFGGLIAEKIKGDFTPLFDPEKEQICDRLKRLNEYVYDCAGYELFDAQLAAAEGLKRRLEKDKFAMLVSDCGTGKTKIGAAALYAYQNKKSFNAVICPSHLCEKWVRELHETYPSCIAKVVDSISDADKMYELFKTGSKTVFCIISKEKSRDGYMKMPAVYFNKRWDSFHCPHCDEIQMMPLFTDGCKEYVKADSLFYRHENCKNHKCENCGEVLWTALNPDAQGDYQRGWIKVSDYGFVYRPHIKQHLNKTNISDKHRRELWEIYGNPERYVRAVGAVRRYPLSQYFKKKIKHLDALIIDELHQYSGDSGQGAAMADLAKIAKKVIGMTATLINGYSKGMFYLMFRLKPMLMKLDEQEFTKTTDFCRQYGVVQRVHTEETAKYNANSKSRKSTFREKFLPGVSPLIYSRFLLDNAVFLSLTDMAKELPEYEEIPIALRLLQDIQEEYDSIQRDLLSVIRSDSRLGPKLLSKYLNLLTAYPDQPYGHEPIRDPFNPNMVIVSPESFGGISTIHSKDEEILRIVERKVAGGERVIIYTAWVRLDTQKKLYNLFTERGYRAKILDVSVNARKREAWVEKQVQSGIDVLITNAKLVETGLDLNDFTTLVFYNNNFDLYAFRQASRRSWRINQKSPRIEVYMLYYENTIQHKALKLMASKLSAATLIEGNISDEGLAAMSDCNDMTSQLAKELAEGIKDNVADLSDTFKKMALLKPEQEKVVPEKTILKPISKPIVTVPKPKIRQSESVQFTFFDLLAG